MLRRLAVSAWLGLALAALFFYPLAVALDTDIYYLQWQSSDTIETGAALAALALLFGASIFGLWPRTGRGALVALIALAALPLTSFLAGVVRQLPFDDTLRGMAEYGVLRYGLPVAGMAMAGAGIVLVPDLFLRWFRRLLILVSPVWLVVAQILIASFAHADSIVSVDRARPAAEEGAVPAPAPAGCAPVLALLFDELSFSYLYDQDRVRQEYPAMASLASQATNYLAVAAPGPETLVAMPSFLSARHLRDVTATGDAVFEVDDEGRLIPFTAGRPEALFPTARRLGYTTEMAGYYLRYCELLDGLLDRCQSLSFYNVSSAAPGFSLVDPVLTTLVLWPRQFPFGLLKNPPFAALQRRLVESTTAFAARPLAGPRPVFRFVHFSVPHFPFVFGAGGYDPPFDPLRTSPDTQYVGQLAYVDSLLGELVRQMRADGTYDPTTIVVLGDHGFRFGGRERDTLHIPFIVKMAGQGQAEYSSSPARGEVLLKQVLENSCAAPGGATSSPR